MSNERKSGGAGKIFLGMFLGFVLTIGSIIGLGCFVYFKGSIRLINKFGANIDTGSNKLNNMTISQIVKSGTKVLGNTSTYSLEDLAEEFGYTIKTEVMGVDITDLTNKPISNLSDAIKDKFKNISASEIEGVVDLSSIDGVLSSKRTFYVYNGMLYVDEAHTNEVDFSYTISNNAVKLKVNTFDVVDGKIEVQNRYLPLSYAMGDIQNNTLAEVLNYTYADGKYYDKGTELKGILKILAPKKVGEITTTINNLTIVDLFGDTSDYDIENSVFSLIPNYQTLPLTDIPKELESAIKTATIDDLVTKGIIQINPTDYAKVSGTIGAMNISDVVNAYIQYLIEEQEKLGA